AILEVLERCVVNGTHHFIMPCAAHSQYIADIADFFTLRAIIIVSQNIPKIRHRMKRNIALYLFVGA
ncbi:MAG: hypothetical protein IJS96_00725, partial [Schwartzia sp.]|nr:hypothetical protein [Schwartzia sp. (in: firmicutes)]